jgi:hypothetical protein
MVAKNSQERCDGLPRKDDGNHWEGYPLAGNAKGLRPGDMTNGYEENWREYKRIRNTFLLVFITYVPVCFAVGVASMKLLGTFAPGFVVAGLWMILFLFNGVRLNTWRCPRCGECFSGTWWYNLGFLARRCVHCGLTKYGDSSRTVR